MNIQKIPLSKTKLFDKLITDYINAEASAIEFSGLPQSVNSIFLKTEGRRFSKSNREILVNSLLEQYLGLENEFPKVLANVNLLSESNVFTITTGHQLNLFTGPVYFIYKIFSTIKLAEYLNKKASTENKLQRFVPVYWMHTEDHDFDEINHFYLFGKKIEWHKEGGNKGMAGDILLENSSNIKGIDVTYNLFVSLIGNNQYAKELVEFFQRIYLESKDLKTATFRIVNDFFSQYGLIVLDSNQPSLKRLFIDQIKKELNENHNSKILKKTNTKLENAGYKVTVNPREINVFYTGKDFRERIMPVESGFEILNQHKLFSKEEMYSELNQYPERFSPNVVMRPLYQETILPNVAYIGGAGELGYWLQYKGMFEANDISYPVLWLRNSVLWIDKSIASRIGRLGLEINNLFDNTELLINKFVVNNIENIDLQNIKTEIDNLLVQIIEISAALDKTLEASAKAETQKIHNAIENIEAKMLRASKVKLETQINQIRRIKEKLFPRGKLQERTENFSQYYLSYGKQWFDIIYEAINPLESDLTLIVEEE